MKFSERFTANSVRPRRQRLWSWRLGGILGALFAAFGILLAMAGTATLLGRPPALGSLNDSGGDAWGLLIVGLVLLALGIIIWRRCRQRLRFKEGLSLSPHLMKKRD